VARCDAEGTDVLLSERRITAVIPTVTGTRVHFRCWCGADGWFDEVSRRRAGSAADVAVAAHDVLGGGELAEAHGAAGVQLLGADADLRPEAELLAVDEAG
jgi:hypothetical protein